MCYSFKGLERPVGYFDLQTCTPFASRDSGNDFWIPKIGSDNSRLSFIFFERFHIFSVTNRKKEVKAQEKKKKTQKGVYHC